MRAVHLKNLEGLDLSCSLENESFHHLKNVARVRLNDEVLFLDGKGHSRKAFVQEISKKKILCEFNEDLKYTNQKAPFVVALAQTKKESLELSLKQLVEIGIQEIYLFESDFSQRIELKQERLDKLLISALEQSNALFLPSIKTISFENLLSLQTDKLVYFSSISSERPNVINKDENLLIVIGPEGGLSNREEEQIKKMNKSITINLPTNILRASTAASFCSGYLLGKIELMN